MTTLAYLGPAGTFSEQVALTIQSHLPGAIEPVAFPSIMATVAAVAGGEVTWGIVPVENSLEGGVAATLDGCWQTDGIFIHRAYILPIRYALVSTAADFVQIQRVYSHPQALGQCRMWLHEHLPHATSIPSSSTTAELDQLRDPQVGVICSIRAAEMLKLPVLAWISGQEHNQTRFWLLNRNPAPGGSLTSLALSLPANVPGALLKPLHIFAARQLNLARIESRPTKKSAGTYVFFLDVEHPGQRFLSPEVLADLQVVTETLKILGSYEVITLS
ncbi:MAG: prephenate dehydratase [Thermostichales cyanobacterium BF4_bins_65]